MRLKLGKKEVDLSSPLLMGVINCTPDSFSGDGTLDVYQAVSMAEQMVKDGAFLIDVGGESSRPGSDVISEKEELKRVLPVVKKLVNRKFLVSVDTYKASVAEACLKGGAHMINDISGGKDPGLWPIVVKYNVPYVLMHMQGTPKTMQEQPHYEDVVSEVKDFFVEKIQQLKKAGVKQIILDPGIGFGKRVEDNLALLHHLKVFVDLGFPVLIGASRKSFIGKLTGAEVHDRLPGTLAAHILAVLQGATIIRCHDVKEHKQALVITKRILQG